MSDLRHDARYTDELRIERARHMFKIACEGKHPYDSRATAEAVGRRYGNRAYKCKGCGKWHIGRLKEDRRRV